MQLKRNEEIVRLRQSGMTLQEIANRYGISRERVRQIYNKQKRIEAFKAEWFPIQDTSICNILKRGGVNTVDEFLKMSREDIMRMRGVGEWRCDKIMKIQEELKSKQMTELDKLEQYLKEHDYPYKRVDEEGEKIPGIEIPICSRHQLIVYGDKEKSEVLWDAICHYGSYGFEQGLIEVMGEPVVRSKEDSVEGWLTAEEIIKRLEENENA